MTVEQLIAQLSDSGNAIWAASLRQNRIVLWQLAGVTALWALCGLVVLGMTLAWRRHDRDAGGYSEDNWKFFGAIAGGAMIVWGLIMVAVWIFVGGDILTNPEWAAASRILGQFGGD